MMELRKPDSAVVTLLEGSNWTFMGFDSLDAIIAIDSDECGIERVLDWEIQTEPFLSVSHRETGAWWIPPRCRYDLRETKRLVWMGIRADVEKLVEVGS